MKFLGRGYFLNCGHLAIPAKLHCPKGGRINESLLYIRYNIAIVMPRCAHVHSEVYGSVFVCRLLNENEVQSKSFYTVMFSWIAI